MKKKPVWTLEGNVLDVLGEHNLSQSDRMEISKVCREFEEGFKPAAGDKRTGPDFQEADVILKVLEGRGYKLPEDYKANKEEVLYNLVEGDIGKCAPKRDADLARKVFLNRRYGRPSLDREGD